MKSDLLDEAIPVAKLPHNVQHKAGLDFPLDSKSRRLLVAQSEVLEALAHFWMMENPVRGAP